MKVNELTNLWVATNETENFKALVCALDRETAQEIATEYGLDSHMEGSFSIKEFSDTEETFDCDYVLTSGV